MREVTDVSMIQIHHSLECTVDKQDSVYSQLTVSRNPKQAAAYRIWTNKPGRLLFTLICFRVSQVITHDLKLQETDEVVKGKVEWRGRPALRRKHGGIRSSIPILVASGLENTAAVTIGINGITYLTVVLHMQVADAASQLTTFFGTTYFLTIFAAALADTKLGRFRVTAIFGSIEFLGLTLLAIQSHLPSLRPPPCNIFDPKAHCEELGGGSAAFFFVALYLLALGSGGMKTGLTTFGADQFDVKDPKEARVKSSFFNFYLLLTNVGSIIGLTLLAWIQDNKGWDLALTLSAVAMLISVITFIAGTPTYRMEVNTETSALLGIVQVFVAATRNRNLKLPDNPKELYEIEEDREDPVEPSEFLPHTDSYRFLDKAAIRQTPEGQDKPRKPWRLCTVTQVETVKILIGLVPVFLCTIFMTVCLTQLVAFSIQQGQTMDTRLGALKIPPASLAVFPLSILIPVILFYDRIVVPILRKITGIPTGITHLQRVGVGLLLGVLAMAISAIVEIKRKQVARDHHMLDAIPGIQPLPISVFWLSFQFFIFVIADLFTLVGLIEFFYSEAPKSVKSLSTCFFWISTAVGSYVGTALVKIVKKATKDSKSGGWLAGNNLNRNHLNRYFWMIAVLGLINFVVYLVVAIRYKYRPQEVETPEAAAVAAATANHPHQTQELRERDT